jgi:predicted MFS family arabinose efflux permease
MRVFWLALAAFAIGTESFVLAGLLPVISRDLHIPVAVTGQLITAYALTYAIGSPVLAVAFHNVDRKATLVTALAIFIFANVMAVCAPSFRSLMLARIVMAIGTGLCTPTALSVAVAISPIERRGRAVASVMTGLTLATVLGMPIGTLIGNQISWRAPFVLAATIAALALLGIVMQMPRGLSVITATLGQRLAIAVKSDVCLALLTTTFWAMGGFTLFTYLTVPLRQIGYTPTLISFILFAYGAAGAFGNTVGGYFADRLGTGRTAGCGLAGTAIALGAFSLILKCADAEHVRYLAPAPIILWGFCSWSINPSQATSISRSVPHVAPIALSLNSSFMNLGFALGSSLGGIVLSASGATNLGWVGGLSVVGALLILIVREERAARILVD